VAADVFAGMDGAANFLVSIDAEPATPRAREGVQTSTARRR